MATPVAPAPDEVRVVVFGKGHGESILVHLADGEWMVVDSLLARWTEDADRLTPPALDYLAQIDVGPEAVSTVVLTHLHADHGHGLDQIVERCTQADLWFSNSLSLETWDRVMETAVRDAPRLDRSAFRSMVDGYLTAVQRGRFRLTGSFDGLRLHMATDVGRVTALAPFGRAQVHSVTPPKERDARVASLLARHNATSIVLWVQVGDAVALLGADLENDADVGWEGLLEEHQGRSELRGARLVKIPHHGSEQSQDPAMYDRWTNRPTGVLTPNRRGSYSLPTDSGIQVLKSLTSELLITGAPSREAPAGPYARRGRDQVWVVEASATGRGPTWSVRCTDPAVQVL